MIYVQATFEKTGNLKYISHLDLQRAMTRLLLRSGLPICFSEGFNPHPKLTFAQPLSIYQESLCEQMEFRMECVPGKVFPTEQETLDALRAVSPEQGLTFTDVHFSERKQTPCKAAAYELTFVTARSASEVEALLSRPLFVTKKSKTQEKTLDISPLITEKQVRETPDGICLSCVLPCGDAYLNPNYVVTALGEGFTVRRIVRTRLIF